MTRFQMFVAERQLTEYLNYLNTLDEQQLHEELASLDEATYELVEAAINEGVMDAIKKRVLPCAAAGLMGVGALAGANKAVSMMKGGEGPAKSQGVQHVETGGKVQTGVKKDGKKDSRPNVRRAVMGTGVSSDPSDD
jgi:hypothetical protein